MQIFKESAGAKERGNAAVILLNLVVFVLIIAIGAGYYLFQMRPEKAVKEFERAQELERKGHLTGAELAYREAVRLNPSNPHYHRYLDAIVRGEGNLNRLPEEGTAVGASAALWPEEERISSTPSLAGARVAPVVNTVPPPEPERVVRRRNVEIEIIAPGGAEIQVRAENAEAHLPGDILQVWSPAERKFQRQLAVGDYVVAVRAPGAEVMEERIRVRDEAGALQSERYSFGLMRIEGEPEGVEIIEEATGAMMGRTPIVMLKRPGPVAYTLKAEGYESSTVEGEVESRGVLVFNHQLAKVAPPPVVIEKIVEVPKPEPKPEPKVVALEEAKKEMKVPAPEKRVEAVPEVEVVAAITGQPIFGKPFVSADGIEYFFGEKSNRGDPFWMTRTKPMLGWSKSRAANYCAALTARERAAGRMPAGYAYFPSLAGDGRIALCKDYSAMRTGPDGVVVQRLPSTGVEQAAVRRIDEPLPTRKAIVIEAGGVDVPRAVTPGATRGIQFGRSFRNSGQMWMEPRERDVYGNPYWRSDEPVLEGKSRLEVNRYIWELTERERAAGRIPPGYSYAASAENDGRIVLWRSERSGISVSR